MFPLDEARQATEFLVATWYRITKDYPDHLKASQLEPVLTENFWWYLSEASGPIGRLTGQWSYERHSIERDPATKRLIKRIRLDITYFSNARLPRLDMVFEFKKLAPDSRSCGKYRGAEGLGRFVDGYYAKHQPFAAMVGMTLRDRAGCISKLTADLGKPNVQTALSMVTNAAGKHVCSPSELFGSHAAFDTQHERPADQTWSGGKICVAHIFLPLPGCS
ncbi:hypothetical protein [Castellaniella sp.]|uniref:hypothetical protein n=1 Tax=Castellaniella sp. TaxID=1955812 RepID=UPI002AFEB195|nr:hypothetical protein [Castellaniella sp.]